MSCIGPISLTAQDPVVVFHRSPQQPALQLLARGSLQTADPDRIILKRIILTGNPIRVRKRFAVVKHMFRDPQDVKWFKPAELVTLHGLRGHIKCSVGTHGLYKALFSHAITQNDQVMLYLYKRVYPKFMTKEEAEQFVEGGAEKEDSVAADDMDT